jgi:hypothetical protein
MVAARRGGSTLGCLVTLLIIGTAVYVGIALGRPWFRYEQFRDEMTSAARFSTTLTDAQILTRLVRWPTPSASRPTPRRSSSSDSIPRVVS